MRKKQGIGIKKYLLKKWIYGHDHTQPYVARKMGLTTREFKQKLLRREKFNRKQIEGLVRLMGAEDAFEVLYFPTYKARQKIHREVFGKPKMNGRVLSRKRGEDD